MTNKKRHTRAHEHKRYGHHQRHTRHFLKPYLPYLPLALILLCGFVLGLQPRPQSNGVLAYASDLNIETLLAETNEERSIEGKPQLRVNEKLNKAAAAKAVDMASRDYWSHVTPDGEQPWRFIDSTGYTYQKAGENLAYGFLTSDATVAGWMNSPAHRTNLLDESFSEVGFGFADAPNYQGNGPQTVVVAFYARNLAEGTPKQSDTVATANQAVRGSADNRTLTGTKTFKIARIQVVTDGNAPWSAFALGLAGFTALGVLVMKHGLQLRRIIARGERLMLHHPLFDLTVLSFVVLCYFVSRVEGFILSATIAP